PALMAVLGLSLPAQASATLGFGYGNTQDPSGSQYDPNSPTVDPGNQAAGSHDDPYTTLGLNDWTYGTAIGTTNGATLGTSDIPPVAIPHLIALANLRAATATTSSGISVVSLTDMDSSNPNWSNQGGTSLDAAVFVTIPQLYIHVNSVPEPSSLALFGLTLVG